MVLQDKGDWFENTKLKPEAILNAFKINPVVLWLDADCLIDPPEALIEGDWDIGTLDNIHPTHKARISAGFILFRDTKKTRRFLKEWALENKKHKRDHPAFIETLKNSSAWLSQANISAWLKGRHTINALAKHRGVYEG